MCVAFASVMARWLAFFTLVSALAAFAGAGGVTGAAGSRTDAPTAELLFTLCIAITALSAGVGLHALIRRAGHSRKPAERWSRPDARVIDLAERRRMARIRRRPRPARKRPE